MHRAVLGVGAGALALLVTVLTSPVDHPGEDLSRAAPARADVVSLASSTKSVATLAPRRTSRACSRGLVALTFDDGPSKTVTPGLVRSLLRLGVPATFFMVGSRIKSAPSTGRLVQNSGFAIGNHTWSHPQLTHLSDAAVKGELRRTRGAMKRHGITPTTLMRPPYGDVDSRVRKDIRSLGLYPVLWTIDSGDWEGGNARQISDRILKALRPHRTNIVLQHDGVTNSPSSVAAVPRVVKEARKRGYCFAGLGKHGGVARPVPQVRATVTRGHEKGTKAVRVRLDLDRPTSHAVSLRVETVPGTATAGADFRSRTLRVVFATGVRHAWFTVPVYSDGLLEPTEAFRVVLSEPRGVTFRHASYTARILDAPAAG